MKLVSISLISLAMAAAAAPARASVATDAFANLKALAGTWDVDDGSGTPSTATYEVDSDGSVVLEHMMGMVTTYYVDGDKLAAMHYCSAHNEPHLASTPAATATVIALSVVDVGNLPDANAGYMAKLTLTIVDANHFNEAWTWRQNGADQAPFTITFARHQ